MDRKYILPLAGAAVLGIAILLLGMGKLTPKKEGAPVVGDGVAVQAEAAKPQVEIFGTSWCPYCEKAKDFFSERGVAIAFYDIESDAAALQRKKSLDPRGGVPLVVIGEHTVYGYSPNQYEVYLDELQPRAEQQAQ